MNILILNSDGKCLLRPDTSLSKENEDFYAPEDVSAIGFSPAVFARISKAGKMVMPEFAERYYDSVAFGILLHPSTELREGKAHYCKACSSVYDHSTLLPYPLYNRITLTSEENNFEVFRNGESIFKAGVGGIREKIEDALVRTSAHTSVRIGDFVAVELAGVKDLLLRAELSCALSASYCGNKTIDIKINY